MLALKSQVALLRSIHAGEAAGYGRTFLAKRDTLLAVLPIGYGDGYPRALSGKGRVMIRGRLVPVAGRICMDQLTVDVTDLPEVAVGDEAVLVDSRPGSCLSASSVANTAGTIPNELLCRLGERLPRLLSTEKGRAPAGRSGQETLSRERGRYSLSSMRKVLICSAERPLRFPSSFQ